jgi:hypothetical protein
MNRIARRALAVTLALLGPIAAPARAADDGPCTKEVARWCDGTRPSEVVSCLQSHRADLSADCRDYLEFVLVSTEALLQDCEPDAFQMCRNVGRGRPTVECLAAASGKLTRRCQEDFDRFVRLEVSAAKDCEGDAVRECPGVKPGKGNLAICLIYKGRKLSPACRKALAP